MNNIFSLKTVIYCAEFTRCYRPFLIWIITKENVISSVTSLSVIRLASKREQHFNRSEPYIWTSVENVSFRLKFQNDTTKWGQTSVFCSS